jgi:hypothetical protein
MACFALAALPIVIGIARVTPYPSREQGAASLQKDWNAHPRGR